MDAGGRFSSSSSLSSRRSMAAPRCPRGPLQEVGMRYLTHSLQSIHTRPTVPSRKRQNCDRFIPDRSSMDMDVAHYLVTESCKKNKTAEGQALSSSPSKEAYRKCLAETMLQNRTRILSFKSKPPTAPENNPFLHHQASHDLLHNQSAKPTKQRRYISQSAERVLDAPDLVDDYYLNLLDWGSANVLAIALGNMVYLWDAASGSTSELATIDDDAGPITSVGWAADGRHIAVGLNNSDVQLWDSDSARLLRTLRGAHASRVGAMSWNGHLLTTGGMDGLVVNNDVRVRDHVVNTYSGHTLEVCGLKWSPSGQYLASGANDNLVHIWDVAMSSSSSNQRHHQQNPQTPWLHRLSDHAAAVKALAWCPFQSNLLASGGGGADRCIKLWNTHTGSCLNSVDTGSQVCALLWSKADRELLSAHGFMQNQLTLWKYPSMTRMAELTGHTSRVLFMAQSPDGSTVASAAGDETLRLWNAFGAPEKPKPTAKSVGDSRITGINQIR